MAERVLASLDTSAMTASGWSWYNAVRTLVIAERYDLALPALDAALEHHRERGSLIDVGGVLTFRAELYVHLGDLANAEVDARMLHEISTAYGWPLGIGMATAALGEVLSSAASSAEAEAVLFAGSLRRAGGGRPARLYEPVGAGRARRAAARPGALRRGGRRAARVRPAGARHRPRQPGRAGVALAARARADGARADATRPSSWPRRSSSARGATAGGARSGSRCWAAATRHRARLAPLHEAVAVLDGSEARARDAPARTPSSARRCARTARWTARAWRCGAPSTSPTAAARRRVEDAALAELRATGARPRRRLTTGAGALTPSERRIAELAAGGRQNREIAEALFVTTATVEYHLRNAYRKLGISSRTQLAESL